MRCYTDAVAIVFALASAIAYGVSDYGGGRLSRRVSPMAIAFVADAGLLVTLTAVVPLVETEAPTAGALVWSAVAGACVAVGTLGLYEALSRGNMTVVAPITGVVATIVPVVTGLALGERPAVPAFVGIVVAVVAVALIGGVTGASGGSLRGSTLALAGLVGVSFGLMYVAYAQAGDDSGLWPLLGARLSATPILAFAVVVARRRGTARMPARSVVALAVGVGLVSGLANGLYLLAVRRGLLSVVSSLGSLYPASTVALAALLDRERASRGQLLGMAMAGVAVVLITLGS